MKATNLHHLGVPCIAKEKKGNVIIYEKDDIFYINPSVIIRYEPGGAVITSPTLYSSFIFVNIEMTELIKKRSFVGKNIPTNVLETLLNNNIISRDPFSQNTYREMIVEHSSLPTQVLFEITSFCNCDCIACYHHEDLNDFTPTFEEIIKRINKLKSLGVGLFEITGGEPFSRPDLYKILNYINQIGLNFYVVTNGSYLLDSSDELIEALKNGLGVAVSLDGTGNIHDSIRRYPGLYDKMLKGIDFLYNRGIKFYFISTISKESLKCIDEMINVAHKYDTTIHLRPVIKTGAAIINNLESLDLVKEIGSYLNNPNVRNGLLSTKKTIIESCYLGCGLRKRISVDSRGVLYPCVMDRSRHLGNIEEYTPESLIRDLENEAKFFLNNIKECRECSVNINKIKCGGFCRFSNIYKRKKENNYDA